MFIYYLSSNPCVLLAIALLPFVGHCLQTTMLYVQKIVFFIQPNMWKEYWSDMFLVVTNWARTFHESHKIQNDHNE